MRWVYLDDGFYQHPKVLAAGTDAAWMFVAGLCWTNQNLTAGLVPKVAVRLLTDKRNADQLAQRLLEVGLWEELGDQFMIHDYDFWNRTAKSLSDKARQAAEKRWKDHARADAQAYPPADAGALPEQSSGNAHARTRAPVPIPNPMYPSSSPTDSARGAPDVAVAGAPAEEEIPQNRHGDVQGQAWALMAQWDLDAFLERGGKLADGAVRSWLRTAAGNRRRDHAVRARELVKRYADLTPRELGRALLGDALPTRHRLVAPPEFPDANPAAAVQGLAAAKAALA